MAKHIGIYFRKMELCKIKNTIINIRISNKFINTNIKYKKIRPSINHNKSLTPKEEEEEEEEEGSIPTN